MQTDTFKRKLSAQDAIGYIKLANKEAGDSTTN